MSSDGKAATFRLNQFLARAGVASRRHAEELIRAGRVTVNGQTVTGLATTVDGDRDSVKVDGKRVRVEETQATFALYKPKEVVSTLEDPEGRPCLRRFLPPGVHGLFPVGRLDYHSEGLILLTTDGELANRLIHPRHKVVKVYNVKVKGDPPVEALDRLRRGIVLEGRRTLPVDIRRIPSRETRHTWLQVRMSEGRKNQLREMFFRIEHPVIKLKRVAMGPVGLGQLKPGQVRPLSGEEVADLQRATGLLPGGIAPPPDRIRPPRDDRRPPRPSGEGRGRASKGPSGKGRSPGRPARASEGRGPRGRSGEGSSRKPTGRAPRKEKRR